AAGNPTEGGEYCLAVSALAPYKRLEVAVAACARLGLELRLVGEGPERARLERAASAASGGKAAPVRFLGRVDGERLRELYRGALCLLQPGVEDFGIASVEALACGCPVVAAGRGGVLDVVDDGVHGVLHSEDGEGGAVAAAIDKIRRIRFNSLDLRRRAEEFSGARFRERIQSLLSRPVSR
ncbi:MAG TPA: glycosyltransferase, partial [Thermoanaerobaculia bacterium]|nr:glycosyltransferase [Thermoanaerobaculia bacterium]